MGELMRSLTDPDHIADSSYVLRAREGNRGLFSAELKPEDVAEVERLCSLLNPERFEFELLPAPAAREAGWTGYFWPWRAAGDTRAWGALFGALVRSFPDWRGFRTDMYAEKAVHFAKHHPDRCTREEIICAAEMQARSGELCCA